LNTVSIIIVNWNTKDILEDCLNSLIEIEWERIETESEIIVVDNASFDSSAQMVKEKFPEVRLIENQSNPGFGAGVNQAAAVAKNDFLLISNADVIYNPSAIKEMIDCLKSDEKITAAAPALIGKDGKKQASAFKFPTLSRLTKEQLLSSRDFGEITERSSPENEPDIKKRKYIEVDWILGASFIIKTAAFHDVEGFSEGFFMYSEEIDLFYRIKKRGGKIAYLPHTTLLHLSKASTSKIYQEMILRQTLSAILFFEKNHGKMAGFIAKTIILMGQTARFCLFKALSLLSPRNAENKIKTDLYLFVLKGLLAPSPTKDRR